MTRSIIFALFVSLLFAGCKKEKFGPELDGNGLTRQITDLVPQEILDEMRRLGMPIHGGGNPPIIENSYFVSPMILLESNRPGDTPGMMFTDLELAFNGQDNDNLTINALFDNQGVTGNGAGSFIVGNDCSFTVFVEFEASHTDGSEATFVHVFSGELANNGIRNFHCALFMLDNRGNPTGIWIEDGEGRVIYDSDGFSPETGSRNVAWYEQLPDCPCEYSESIGGTEEMCGVWEDCGSASGDFHYGATYEVRWIPSDDKASGQQCTYDGTKRLITGGIAAGSPDKVSPGSGCSWVPNSLAALLARVACVSDHCEEDVKPWGAGNDGTIPCWQYLRDWPANNGCSAPVNVVSGIDHMRAMIGDMPCSEATFIIKTADESPRILIDADLRAFILGENVNLSKTQLIDRLRNWKARKDCANYPDDTICTLIDKALANLQ